MGFTVVGVFIMYRDLMQHLHRMHLQNQNTWNAIQDARNNVEGLHDKYSKLYDRVTKLETSDEIHS